MTPEQQSIHLAGELARLQGEVSRLERELEQVKAILADPLAVHLNMMRGTIKWTPANLRHLLGDPNNLEGAGPTEEERRENARAIQAMSEPERFRLMFHGPSKEQP